MKAVVIGLGSMGKRRVRLLKQYDPTIALLGIDSSPERCEESRSLYGVEICADLHEAVEKGAECAFVCASPLAHHSIIMDCLNHGLHVFTELNVVSDGYDEMQRTAQQRDRVLFLSSAFLYRAEIQYIKCRVRETGGKFNYFYHVGQYLPDWHPWESYQNFFVADKRTNGLREVLVREFPWLTETFGDVVSWKAEANKVTELKLNYPDTYLMTLTHADGTKGMYMMDLAARKSVIHLEVFNEHLYLTWDGTPTGLTEYDYEEKKDVPITVYESFEHNENYSRTIIEDVYVDEIRMFFDQIQNGTKPEYDFAKDQKVLNVLDEIEEALLNA